MTNALRLITEVRAAGGRVEIVQPDKLRVVGPIQLVKQVRANKPAVIEALQQAQRAPDDANNYALEERAAIIEGDGVPRDWAEGFAKLCTMSRPAAYPQRRWEQLLNDGGLFLDQWRRQVVALGWTHTDVFGVCPAAPETRLDGMGLVPLLYGRKVCALTQDTARIDCGDGITTSFTRKTLAACAVPLWELT